jgi:predicted enzyme related to lactoylglutathione lyase
MGTRNHGEEEPVKVTNFLLNITSEDPERLKAFYGDVIGLEKNADMGDDAFHAGGGATLAIDGHSETKGGTKEPQRYLIDFFVEDVKSERERLEAKGVNFIRKEG